jgi:hypothetical protein
MKKSTQNFSAVILILAIFLALLESCSTQQNLLQSPPQDPVPDWVAQHPIDNAYYIGIGSCSKKNYPTEFNSIAKKNALNDMASSVSVRVQGESFLNTMEVNKVFSEDFSSSINTTTDIVFDDFETVATYDNGKDYWIYIRLSKYDYQQQQAQKKKAVLDKAFDFFQRGNTAISKYQVNTATDMWLHGLFAMKNYWSESNPYPLPSGEEIILDQSIYNALQENLSNIRLSCDESAVLLTAKDRYSRTMNIGCTIEGKNAVGVPVQYFFPTERYMKPKKVLSNSSGIASIDVQGIPMDARQPQLEIAIEMDALIPSDLNEAICKSLLQSSLTQTLKVPITLIKPSFCIMSEEREFDNAGNQKLLAGATESFLAQKGYTILPISQIQKADFLVEIKANTKDAGQSSDFSSAILDLTLTMRAADTQLVKYQNNTNSIKGVQLNTQAAGSEAYKKGKIKLEEEWLKAMLQSIL